MIEPLVLWEMVQASVEGGECVRSVWSALSYVAVLVSVMVVL